MKNTSFRSRSLQLMALLALGTPTALLLQGCGGGSSKVFGSNPTTSQTNAFTGTVDLSTTQRGVLNVRTFSDRKATGTLTISNVTQNFSKAQITTFRVGVYNLTGSVSDSDGTISLRGNMEGVGEFSIRVTPPTGTSAGSFTSTFGTDTFSGTIPAVTPTTVPTTNPTTGATTAPTTPPTGGGNVPVGNGSLTISLTSSNSSLSGGNIVNGVGSTAVVDQVGGANRINLIVSNNALPPTLFNLLVSKTGTFVAGDVVTVQGDAGTSDLITLLVTNISNPAASGTFRAQSGTFKIDSISGRRVNFTVANLRMVSQTSSASFNLNGSGSFTIQ